MMGDWPETLDAVTAAGEFHAVTLENERVRVLDTHVSAGSTVPLHTHRWPAVHYIVSWSDFVRRDANGRVVTDSRGTEAPKSGSTLWSAPMTAHTLQNVGENDLHVVSVEIKER